MSFTFSHVPQIPDLITIEPNIFSDERGYFYEGYKKTDFKRNGITDDFVQENFSSSSRDVLRGLHYQIPPMAQGKLVRVLAGVVWDVALDLRKSSKTFGQWFGVEISSENKKMFYIPAGFAHGFCTLSENALFSYLCTGEYSKEHDRGINYDDPALNISWPVSHPKVSEKDSKAALFARAEFFP